MPTLKDGEEALVQGSAAKPYVIKNIGGVISCSCPAWKNQSTPIERRVCKHSRPYVTDAVQQVNSEPEAVKLAPFPPPVQLAQSWTDDIDPTGWMMSEKLDGVRAWWDGTKFISRQGNQYFAPKWFTARLPRQVLDGELWMGRKNFQKCISVVRRQDMGGDWASIKYMIFDCPEVEASFPARLALLESNVRIQQRHIMMLSQYRCTSKKHMFKFLDSTILKGGEGIMLRYPETLYEAGRSNHLLKVKKFLDGEAVVLSYVPGKGKHKGRLGKLIVQMPDGTEFGLGTGFSDAERENPPKIGSTVTYRYQELTTGGVPRFAAFVGVRDYE